jgi:hypothetical protein
VVDDGVGAPPPADRQRPHGATRWRCSPATGCSPTPSPC